MVTRPAAAVTVFAVLIANESALNKTYEPDAAAIFAFTATAPPCTSTKLVAVSAVETVTATAFPDFPIRIELESEEKVRFAVERAAANEFAPSGDSTTLLPVPFRLSPLKVGLFTSSVTEAFELNTVPLAKVAVPGFALVASDTAPLVDETVPEAKLNSVVVKALPTETSEMLPDVDVTLDPASQTPQPLVFASGAADPVMLIAPESEEITFVPVDAVPPHPSSTPIWFPVPVTPEASAPSRVIVPEVVLINDVFKVSMPVLCEELPTEEESWPRSKTFPAPAVIVPTRRMPE
jgi:hypothetical protein